MDGKAVVSTDFAGFVSTCPVDLTLWHRRFAHLNVGDVKLLISKQMATGIVHSHLTSGFVVPFQRLIEIGSELVPVVVRFDTQEMDK